MPAMEPIPVLNLNEAIKMALTQAKESGEFDGKDGVDGRPGEKGDPGVWVGSEAPPSSDYTVWVDPAGEGSGSSASVQSDWNASEGEPGYIKNRTHYEEYEFEPITWDGNTEGLLCVEDSQGVKYYKVAEPPENMPEGYFNDESTHLDFPVIFGGINQFCTGSSPIEDADSGEICGLFAKCSVSAVMDRVDALAIVLKENVSYGFPEPGVYFVKNNDGEFCSFYAGRLLTHKLDARYLPKKIYQITDNGSSIYTDSFKTVDDVYELINEFTSSHITCVYFSTEFDSQTGVATQAMAKCISAAGLQNMYTGEMSFRLLFLHPVTGEQIKVEATMAFDENGSFTGLDVKKVFDMIPA
jgi:hypothetical protein